MKKRTRRTARLETWFNSVETPVFLLTGDRKVQFFNAGCEQITGWKADEVVGKTCEYASSGDNAAVAAITESLCPPPEVFQGRKVSVPAYLAHRDGRTTARLLNFFPLQDDSGRTTSVLGIVTPIEQPARTTDVSPAQQLHAELASLRMTLRQRFGLKSLVCRSAPMTRVLGQIQLARQSDLPVFLFGERGTGKEHMARLIHYDSEPRGKSFVPLDCARLTALELRQTLKRLFQSVREETRSMAALKPGTLFLMNVESLPRDIQEQIVRAFQPESPETRLKLRLVASSTTNLHEASEEDRVRPDLYYLLTPLQIELPPLRERREDLAPLAQHFLENLNRGSEKQVGGFSEDVWELFRQYNWPGNLDELMAVVDEAQTACTTDSILISDLPFRFRTGLDAQAIGPAVTPKPVPLKPYLQQVEREQIERALEHCRDNKSKAAELLGLTRARLYRRMEVLGIAESDGTRSGERGTRNGK